MNTLLKVRDEYITKCYTFNIDWNKVKDAFILQDEIYGIILIIFF